MRIIYNIQSREYVQHTRQMRDIDIYNAEKDIVMEYLQQEIAKDQ